MSRLKCDQVRPCRNCAKRPAGSCVYPYEAATTNSAESRSTALPRGKSTVLHNRIDRLEKLVADLTGPSDTNTNLSRAQDSTASVAADQVPDTAPQLHANGEQTRFTNSSHWETILDEVSQPLTLSP